MNEELKEDIIEAFQFLAKQNGKWISITDRITTVENNFDRHFTTSSKLKMKQKHFEIRFSGAIGMLEGENQSFEFRTANIQKIVRNKHEIEFEIQLKQSVFRLIQLKIEF